MPSMKRIAVALLLLPVTLPFLLFWQFMEWFHFAVSNRLLVACRRANKRMGAFFDTL